MVPDTVNPREPGPGTNSAPDSLEDSAPAGAFAFFSLEGTRFDGRGMPADAGREVAAYREAVLQAARTLYKDRHGGNIPSVFNRAFDLRLVRIGGGSARPEMVLSRGAAVSDEQWAEFVELYELGRDLITQQVDAVATADEVPPEYSRGTRRSLARLGGTLQETERLRFGPPAAGRNRAVVTPRTRALLRTSADDPTTPQPRAVSVVGVLTEYDGETLSFLLKADDDARKVTCLLEHFNEALAARAREYLALDGVTAPDVRVEGQTLAGDDERVMRIHNVHALDIVWTVAEKVIVHRMRQLAELKAGWLGPGTDAPAQELVDMLEPAVSVMAALDAPVHVVPNGDGSLVMEWKIGDVEYSAELRADHSLLLVADNVVTDALHERELPFDLAVLNRFLQSGATT